jgi:1,4-dihydroxy-2-naphthoate octaprenyltransferase
MVFSIGSFLIGAILVGLVIGLIGVFVSSFISTEKQKKDLSIVLIIIGSILFVLSAFIIYGM